MHKEKLDLQKIICQLKRVMLS